MTQFTVTPQRAVIAEFDNYPSAQSAVDLLADKDFEVGTARIVGHDLKSVELVRGKMTWGRAALFGFLGGAWFGLLLGLLLAIFVPAVVWLSVVLGGVIFAGLFGLVFGLISFAVTGKERGFRSDLTMKASSYTVEVPVERADEALRILAAGR